MSDPIQAQLDALEAEQLLRVCREWTPLPSGLLRDPAGKEYLQFASNDYLGLAQDSALITAAQEATAHYGVGSTGSRLITGTAPVHVDCEAEIARAKGTEAAVFFSTGMMAAHGVLQGLYGKDDTILLDKLSHACLIDAARACGARLRVFPHNNSARLERLLQGERARLPRGGRLLVVVESVYSMDGDLCPLREIIALKHQYGAELLVDEAHGLGVLGLSLIHI